MEYCGVADFGGVCKCFDFLEREMGLEPTTSSLGKCYYLVYQGFSEVPLARSAIEFPEFPRFGCEWNHKGILTPSTLSN